MRAAGISKKASRPRGTNDFASRRGMPGPIAQGSSATEESRLEAGLREMQKGDGFSELGGAFERGFFPSDMGDRPAPSIQKLPFWGVSEVVSVLASFLVGVPLGIWIGHLLHGWPA